MKSSKCDNCDYEGTDGLWKGTATDEKGKRYTLEGIVHLREDNTFDLDPLIHKLEDEHSVEITDFTGEVYCPKCASKEYY